MTTGIHSDSWLHKRLMKLTCFEKQLVNSPRHAQRTERTALALLKRVSLPPRPYCLEIGCGQGALARLLVERHDARVIATDYDSAQVALAQERLADLDGQIEFRVVDARDIPFDEAQFDAVFSFGVLHHIPSGWRKAVAETARVLKRGGWFVFTDLIVTPRAGRLIKQLLPRLDQLEDAALHACLAENDLDLEHYAYDRKEHMTILGVMAYCTAIARKE